MARKCDSCCQDIVRNPRQLYSAIQKLADAGEQAGLSVQDLINLLNAGLTITDLLDFVGLRLSKPVLYQ